MAKKRIPRPGWQGWPERLQNHWEALGMTAGEAAAKLGISEAGLRHKLNGTREITLSKLFAFCEGLGADPYEILGAPPVISSQQLQALARLAPVAKAEDAIQRADRSARKTVKA